MLHDTPILKTSTGFRKVPEALKSWQVSETLQEALTLGGFDVRTGGPQSLARLVHASEEQPNRIRARFFEAMATSAQRSDGHVSR